MLITLLAIVGIIVTGWVFVTALAYYADKIWFGFADWYLHFVKTLRKNGTIQ